MLLGVDFGTSHTVAVLSRPGGRADALLFDSSPLLPSAVYLEAGGSMLVGRDAERSARIEPAAYEPHPKRRIDEGSVLLDGREVPVGELITAILGRVAEEAHRILGGPPGGTVLTHPAGWGPTRRALLTSAADAAGLTGARMVAEPVAAAMYFTGVLGHQVPDGHAVVVYDFGGGTFDISVVRRAGDGWHVVAANGLDDVGGIDLDAAVVGWTRANVAAGTPELWQRLDRPSTVADRRHRRALWEDARSAKEALSRATSAGMAVPLFDVDLHLTRAEFEVLARPWLDRTVSLTTATLFASDVTAGRLAGVFLVGGASRVPLVATLLHQALGIAPVALEQPELVVAHGSLLTGPATGAPVTASSVPIPSPPAPEKPPSAKPPSAKPSSEGPSPEAPPSAKPPSETPPAEGPPSEAPPSEAPPSAKPSSEAPVSTPSQEDTGEPAAWSAWPVVAFAVVLGLGALGLAVHESWGSAAPPFTSGLLVPLLPKPVLVLLAMVAGVVVLGRPGSVAAPAYRALGPAVVAAGGAVAGLFLHVLIREPDRVLSIDGSYDSADDGFDPVVLWVVIGAAAALTVAALYLVARPGTADPLVQPAGRRARFGWFGLWAAAGALLSLATVSQIDRPYVALDDDWFDDVQPFLSVVATDGELTWWASHLLGLTLMIGAALLLGALLRVAVVRHAEVHRTAQRIGGVLVAELGALLLLNAAWEWSDARILPAAHHWYWQTFIVRDGLPIDQPWLWCAAAVGVTAGVAGPSLVRTLRNRARRPS